MSIIAENMQAVEAAIADAVQASARARSEVQLLAVSKTFPAEAVLEAMAVGQRAFGENYLQEALEKIAHVARAQPDTPVEWHFIGPIQSNKTRPIAASFDWVHTVERLKIAQRLSEQRPAELGPLNICLQVNISGEARKSGALEAELPALAREVALLPNLRLRALADALRADGLALDTLSMGMSGDIEAAIAEGATIVRIGSAIFGARHYE